MIRLEDVTKSFASHEALHTLDLCVEDGETLAVIGVLGGWFVAVHYAGIASYTFTNSIHVFAVPHDMTGGLVKAAVFGVVIAVLGSWYGLHAPEGAEGVGRATTKSVVAAIVCIFFLNVFLSFLLY